MLAAPGARVDMQTPGRAGDVAPGRRQHRAGRLLLDQDEAHPAIAGGLHQFDRLAAWVSDDERRPGLVERLGHDFNGARHPVPPATARSHREYSHAPDSILRRPLARSCAVRHVRGDIGPARPVPSSVDCRIGARIVRQLLLDTSSLLYRAFFGLPTSIKDPSGRAVNAVHGYLDMTARLYALRQPDAIVHVFDDVYVPADRAEAYPPYKAHRPEDPPELPPQFDLLEEVLDAFGLDRARAPAWEADDALAALCASAGPDDEIEHRHRRPRPAPARQRRRPDRPRALHRQGRHRPGRVRRGRRHGEVRRAALPIRRLRYPARRSVRRPARRPWRRREDGAASGPAVPIARRPP